MITFILILLLVTPMLLIIGIAEQEQTFLIDTYNYINSKYEQGFTMQSSYVGEDGNLIVKFETEGTEGIDEWVEVVRYIKNDGSIYYEDNFNTQLACDIMRDELSKVDYIYNNISTFYIHRPSIYEVNNIDDIDDFDDVVKALQNSQVEFTIIVDCEKFDSKEDISNFKDKLTNYLYSNYPHVTVHLYIIGRDVCDIATTKGMPYFYQFVNKHNIIPESIIIMD